MAAQSKRFALAKTRPEGKSSGAANLHLINALHLMRGREDKAILWDRKLERAAKKATCGFVEVFLLWTSNSSKQN